MLRIGTCSWKYDSWVGLIYPETSSFNYLSEYSKSFNTVEIDQWFWSLFPGRKVLLPDKNVVNDYKNSVPEEFLFTIKVPNSITLTHYYSDGSSELIKNSNFLSVDLFEAFLSSISDIISRTGTLILQFEYLNKQKMKSFEYFENNLIKFFSSLKDGTPPVAIEIRNPNYMNDKYFKMLDKLSLGHVFLEGYFMPPIVDIYKKYYDLISSFSVIRLHGPDRNEIERIAKKKWNKIYINRDDKLAGIIKMIKEFQAKEIDLFVNVNNHFEGSAPLTIKKIQRELNKIG